MQNARARAAVAASRTRACSHTHMYGALFSASQSPFPARYISHSLWFLFDHRLALGLFPAAGAWKVLRQVVQVNMQMISSFRAIARRELFAP